MKNIRDRLYLLIIITGIANVVGVLGQENSNLTDGVVLAVVVPAWILYTVVPLLMLVSSLVTVAFVRRGEIPFLPNEGDTSPEPETFTATSGFYIVPEPTNTSNVEIEEPGRAPIPINVYEAPSTTPSNPAMDIPIPTISTFNVPGKPTDIFFLEDSLWVSSQDEDGIANYTTDGKLISSMPLHPYPKSLAHDGDELWVSTYFAVRTFDLQGGMGSAPVELRRPTDMLYAGEAMWIANSDRNVVTRISKDRQSVQNIQTGSNPQKLAFDGEHVWVVDSGDDTLTKISTDGEVVGSWSVGSGSRGLAYGNGHVWVVDSLDDTLTRYDLNGEKLGVFPTGALPGDVIHDGTGIWVANRADETMTKYSDDGSHMGTFHIGNAPGSLATDGQGTIWVANPAESMVSKLSMEGVEASTFPVGNSPEPVIWDGDNLWVGTSLSHTISKMNLHGV